MFENWYQREPTKEFIEQRNCLNITTRREKSKELADQINHDTKLQYNAEVCELSNNGIMLQDNVISEEQARQMYNYFISRECYDFYGNHERFNINKVPNHISLGRHTIEDNLKCPGIMDVITNEDIINKASSYLGAPATLSLVLPMWSFPKKQKLPINMQLFHRDADDYKFVKFFIFLNDVTHGEGEQVYFKKTNVKNDLPEEMYQIKRYSSNLINKHLQDNEKVSITGKAGTSWFADTYGIHKGTVPTAKNRLILQLQFSYNPVPIFNYKSYKYSKWKSLSDLAKYSTRLYIESNI